VYLKIECLDDLNRAAALASWLNRPSVDVVEVLLPWLDADEQARSAKIIRDLFNDCGCLWGAPAFVVSVAGVLVPQLVSRGWSWPAFGRAILVGVAAGFAGKLLGLAWSRWRLAMRIRRMGVMARNGADARWTARQ